MYPVTGSIIFSFLVADDRTKLERGRLGGATPLIYRDWNHQKGVLPLSWIGSDIKGGGERTIQPFHPVFH